MKATIDSTICEGHGVCSLTEPAHFDVDDSGYGVVTNPDIPEDRREYILHICPVEAIRFVEES